MTVPVQDLVELAVQRSRADGCVVVAQEGDQADLRWAGNRLTTNGQRHHRDLTVVSVVDGDRTGVVTRPVSTPDDVAALVRDSEAAARDADRSDDVAPLVAGGTDPDWSTPAAATSIDALEGFAAGLGRLCRRAEDRDRVLYGYVRHERESTYVATSAGLRRRSDRPDGGLDVNVKSVDGRRSVWVGRPVPDPAALDLDAVEAELDRRYDWTARRVDLPAGRYDTVLPPSAVADLLVYAYWTMGARDAEEGRTVFAGRAPGATRIGDRLADVPLRMRSDPTLRSLQTTPFVVATSSAAGVTSVFDNGADAGATDWIADGVLRELARSRSWAERTGQPFRPFVDNLAVDVDGATGAEDDLVRGVERGLLLTCLWYIREVDPQTLLLTGLTRDGVFLVEDGAVTASVNNFRFNESPVGMLGRIAGAGASVPTFPREWSDWFTRVAMPPLRVDRFNMSTVSDAT